MEFYRTFRSLYKTLGLRRAVREVFRDFHKARPGYLAKVTVTDKILSATILPLIPSSVIPNYLTLFRFTTVPLILFLLFNENILFAGILFAISAFSDALDGALARTRNQITEWGIFNDPLADKILIGTTVAILVSKYINVWFAATLIVVELAIGFAALYQAKKLKQKIIPAKTVGKMKMIFESVGLVALFIFALIGNIYLFWFSVFTLSLAIIFALLSLFVYKSI